VPNFGGLGFKLKVCAALGGGGGVDVAAFLLYCKALFSLLLSSGFVEHLWIWLDVKQYVTKNRPVHTFVIDATLLALCHYDMFQPSKDWPSSGSKTDTFPEQGQQNE